MILAKYIGLLCGYIRILRRRKTFDLHAGGCGNAEGIGN